MGMIWIQTAWHSTDITEKNEKKQQLKNDFEKKSADDKTMAKLPRRQRVDELKWKVLHVHAGFMLKPYICLLSIRHSLGPI